MHGLGPDAVAWQRCQNSLVRIAVSRNSIESALSILERTRKSIEDSARALEASRQLARDPFYCRWSRPAPQRQES